MSLIRRDVLESLERVLLSGLLVVILAVVSLGVHAFWGRTQTEDVSLVTPTAKEASIPTAAPVIAGTSREVTKSAPGRPESTPVRPNRIGIVAGHWQHDSGAMCDDGLKEVEINLAVAQRVISLLSQSGFDAEILAEFSPRLDDYQAAALVSIHADSCNVPEATGFKVARVSASVVPDLEDRLVACLIEKYSEATGLQFHRNSITYDMTEYHAFYEIAPETAAAIIEIGFMGADRQLLTKEQDRVAQGIVNGIKCFISGTR